MKTIPVMISGKQGSGKDSLYKELEDLIDESCDPGVNMIAKKVRFAGPFYEIHDFAREKMRELGFEVLEKDGDFLQYLGNEWGKSRFGEDVWVKAAHGDISAFAKSLDEPDDLVGIDVFVPVLADTRFLVEVEAFPKAYKVRLECPEAIRKARILATPGQNWRENTTHRSEIELDDYQGFNKIIFTDLTSAKDAARLVFADLLKIVKEQ